MQDRPHAVRLMPLAIVVALAAGLVTATAPEARAAAGATLPFTSVEAESATTTGSRIGPDYTQGSLASEASGRQAVRLGAGQRVEFTVPRAANAVTLAYSVPDGQSGSLDVYVNGQKIARTLAVTSKYSFIDTGWLAGSKTHHFYDNSRMLLGRDVQPGDKVAFQSTGVQVTADVAEAAAVPRTGAQGGEARVRAGVNLVAVRRQADLHLLAHHGGRARQHDHPLT